MKKSIRKLFKLDEPLGRAGFAIVAFVLFFVSIFLFLLLANLTRYASFLFIMAIFSLITPFAARRLKDINANEHFAGLFLLPVLSALFFMFGMNENRHIFEPFIFYYTTAFYGVIPVVLAVFFLVLVFMKGKKPDTGFEQNPQFVRKHTLIIFLLISGTLFIISGVYQLEIYLGKENAMQVMRAVDKYKIEKGSYPAKIKDLVPDYMNEVPKTDGFLFVLNSFDYYKSAKVCEEQWYCISFTSLTGKFFRYCSDNRVWKE